MERQEERCRVRISTDLGNNASIEVFNESPISGDSMEKRDILMFLIKQIEAGKFDRVYVSTLCRLTRDITDGLNIITKVFKKANVILVTANNGPFDPGNPGSFLPLALSLVINQGELENIKYRVRTGIYSRITEGKSQGLNAYGYHTVNQKLVIDDAEAPIVREVYSRYAKGELLSDIVSDFRQRGLRGRIRFTSTKEGKTPKEGACFNERMLVCILSSCIYNGYLRTTLHGMMKSVAVVPAYEENGYAYYKGIHTPIIDEVLWNRVKLRLLKSQQTPHRNRSIKHDEFLLRHLLRCGCCDIGFTSTYTNKPNGVNKRIRYYLCQRVNENSRYTECDIRRIPSKVLENVILDVLSALGNNPDIVDAMLAQAKTMNSRYHDDGKVRLSVLHEQFTEIQFEIKRLVGALRSGEASPIADDIKKEIQHLSHQRKAIEEEIAGLRALQEKSTELPADKAAIINRLHQYSTAIPNLPALKKHELLRLIFKRITVLRMNRPFHGSTSNAPKHTRYFRLNCKLVVE